MKSHQYLSKLLYGLLLCSAFFACEFPQQKRLSQTEKDSVLTNMLNDYATNNESQLNQTQDKLLQINNLLKTISPKPFDSTAQITLQFPICSGNYRDSCFFQSPNMTLLISKEQLKQETINNDLHQLIQVDGNNLLRQFWAVQSRSYRPISANFQDTPFESVTKAMNNELYNLQLFFGLKYLFVLDVTLYTPPTNEYGGGQLNGRYHLFDFEKISYLGTLNISAQNTANYQPPTETTKNVAKIKEHTYSDGKRTYTNRTNVQTQEKQSSSQASREAAAKNNLVKNFKAAAQKNINLFFRAEKSETLWLY